MAAVGPGVLPVEEQSCPPAAPALFWRDREHRGSSHGSSARAGGWSWTGSGCSAGPPCCSLPLPAPSAVSTGAAPPLGWGLWFEEQGVP